MNSTGIFKKLGFRTLGASAAALTLLSAPVHAAILIAADLGAPNAEELESVFRSHRALPKNLHQESIEDSLLVHALKDPENRVSNEFKISKGMSPVVSFWLKIYTKYSTQDVVLFDAKHPEVVYDVLNFSDLAASSKNRIVYEILRERRINEAVRQYRHAFHALARNPRPRRPSEIQRKILKAIRSSHHRHGIAHYSENFKTQTGQRDNVIRGLLESDPFYEGMKEIFASYDLPEELLRISLVESSFNFEATSYAGAKGVWQFMESSGREFMTVTPERGIDERLNPLKSTIAAAKLLRRNHRMLRSWPFAVTAYNNGHRGLRELSANPVYVRHPEKAFGLCQRKAPIGWASSNYYAEFLAMVHAVAYREFFYKEAPQVPSVHVAIRNLDRRSSALQFILENGISLSEFRSLNPDVTRLGAILPRGFKVIVPSFAPPAQVNMSSDTASVRANDIHDAG